MRVSELRRKSWGFTLIELMMVVAIIGILAGVAFPAYKYQIRKGHRAAAHAQLLELANREQQYLLNNRQFATKTQLTSNGYTMPTEVSNNYDWDVATASSPAAFTITFTPITGKVMAGDGNLTLNSSGTKGGTW
jgi:type IV pilus assembly protein PilE